MDSTEKKSINLAGREFKIGFLPFAKNRIVVQAASFALKAINRSAAPTLEPLNITAIDYIYLAVYEAVSHADPKITRDEFNSWGIYLPDLISALMVIALQTGVLVQAKDGKSTSGEA